MRSPIAISRIVTLTLTLILAHGTQSSPAGAQRLERGAAGIHGHGIELRPYAGGFIPTGEQRDLLKSAAVIGAQAGWRFHPNLAVAGSFGWSLSKDRTTAIASSRFRTGREEQLDVFQYDLGVEGRLPIALASSWLVAPYLGLGAGGRTYAYRDRDDVDAQTNAVGYGAVGVDVAPPTGPVGVRFELRDNVSAFKGLQGEYAEREARNDLQVSAGLSWRF